MARTILGLDMVETFTSSETCPERGEPQLSHGSRASRAAGRAWPCPSRGTSAPETLGAGSRISRPRDSPW